MVAVQLYPELQTCRTRLAAIAETGVLSLLPLSCPQLAALLPLLLPRAWQNASQAVPWTPGKGGHPTRAWMLLLWRKLEVRSHIW